MSADNRATLSCFCAQRRRETCARHGPHPARGGHRRSESVVRCDTLRSSRLAESILSRSAMKRREAVLISDFQKSGWSGSEDAHFPEGMTLTASSFASAAPANLSVPSVTFARAPFPVRNALRSPPASVIKVMNRSRTYRSSCRWTATISKPHALPSPRTRRRR